MGNQNDIGCCNAKDIAPTAIYDVQSLQFKHLDFNKQETYKKLEAAAYEFAKKQGIEQDKVPLINRILGNRQQHLLCAYRLLQTPQQKKRFLRSLEFLDIELVDSVIEILTQLYHNLVKKQNNLSSSMFFNIKTCNTLDAEVLRTERKNTIFEKGLEAITQGKVGLLLLCGGKNKRFGGENKFLKPTNTPSKKCILQLVFMRLLALFNLARCKWNLHIFIVCSQQNYSTVQHHLGIHHYYGIDQKYVMFFLQNTIPILNLNGELCLDKDISVIESSNGCGEFLQSIVNFKMKDKVLNQMGVKYLCVSGLENILERPCDPFMIGTMLGDGAEVVAKCVDPYSEQEDFYRYVNVNGRIKSFSPKTIADYLGDQNKLRRSPVTMNSMVYDTSYLNKLLTNPQLRFEISRIFHVDKRSFSYVDVRDNKALHNDELCYIFEKHLADLFIASQQISLIKVPRQEEYAPVITLDIGEHSLGSASNKLLELHKTIKAGRIEDPGFAMFQHQEIALTQ